MPKIGLKLWSSNIEYILVTHELFIHNVFDYIELFIVPGSMETILKWKELGIPYVLHAPHTAMGLNLGDRSQRDTNFELVRQVNDFFSALSPEFVIFHPGVGNDLNEPVLQFRSFEYQFSEMYKKILIENKPQVGLSEEGCLGASPEEIRLLLEGTQCRFCLDFGHAICYSVAGGKNWKDVMANFLVMKPKMYHLCDGFFSVKDTHEHLGAGEFDLPYLIRLVGRDERITLETKKNYIKRENVDSRFKELGSKIPADDKTMTESSNDSSGSLQDFVDDVKFIKTLISAQGFS